MTRLAVGRHPVNGKAGVIGAIFTHTDIKSNSRPFQSALRKRKSMLHRPIVLSPQSFDAPEIGRIAATRIRMPRPFDSSPRWQRFHAVGMWRIFGPIGIQFSFGVCAMSEQSEMTLFDKGMSWHERAIPFLLLIKAEPTVGVLTALGTGVYEIWKRRADIFVRELVALNIDPSEERLRQREYLEGLIATARRVQDTVNETKIRAFAEMFSTYYEGGHFQSIDQFEEYLSILDELSVREFQVLVILHKYELANPLEGRNPLQRAVAVWGSFQAEVKEVVGIEPEQLSAILTRIQRTGLYETITGGFFDYAGGKGALTPLFLDFISTLKIVGSPQPSSAGS